MAKKKFKIDPPYYPIVYVRGYAMTHGEREDTFRDAYYGFSATSVEKRDAPPPHYYRADIFEGQFIRLMKMKDYGYADAVNRGLEVFHDNPSRSVWICRFYDEDYIKEEVRDITVHAGELKKLVCETIPARLKECGVDLGENDEDYRVTLIAHSMGGLVCRTFIQNLLPAAKEDPKRWVHRLVTIGSPHRGIDLGAVPDVVESFITSRLNPFNAGIFREERMRDYLNLKRKSNKKYVYDIHSLGPAKGKYAFPVKRCLCLIGSDNVAYSAVKHVTGDHSDGLVKQSHAYVVGGPKPGDGKWYPQDQVCYYANVHRAHSGYRGIVNSYESYENIQRFLFGNVRAEAWLEGLKISTKKERKSDYFYDIEFLATIKGTGIFLHRREQDPCENAMRFARGKIPKRLYLYTGFLNSSLKMDDDDFVHFMVTLRINERRIEKKFLWDTKYPVRPIYAETLEIRIGDADPAKPGNEVHYRWLSGSEQWKEVERGSKNEYKFDLREADAVSGRLIIEAGPWPDPALTKD